MVEDKKTQAKTDASLEPTVMQVQETTATNLESLLPAVREAAPDSFTVEAACLEVQDRLIEFGPPQTARRALGQYELLETIGSGGMGEVWRARHRKLDRIVAVKLLHPTVGAGDAAGDRFHQEIRAIGGLQHENIVQALDAGEVDGVHYLAMELIEGRSVSELIADAASADQPVSIADACRIVSEAAQGLHSAHENGIVHRDIKPSNIMLSTDGQVKLLDLGLARITQSDEPLPELTREGQVMGTVDYMPPEQLRDSRTASVQADVYALGATFFKLLTGRAPFATADRTTVESKILAIAGETPASVRSLRPDVPEELSDLIAEMLRKDPEQRPQNMSVLCERIAAIQSPAVEAQQTRGPDRRVMFIAASVIGLAVLFGGILIKLRDSKYGDLIIKGPRGVRIVATRVDDPNDSFEFTSGVKGAKLKHGEWEITIPDDEFRNFEVLDGTVRITNARGDAVTIQKRKEPPVGREGDDEPAIDDETGNKPDRDPGAAGQITPAEVAKRFESINWNQGNAAAWFSGYAATPPKIPGIGAHWQIVTAQAHFGGSYGASPKGTYLVTFTGNLDPYLRIVERTTGRLVCCVPGRGMGVVSFAPSETHFSVRRGTTVTVHDLTGNTVAAWESDNLRVQWSPDSSRLLLHHDGAAMEQRTLTGEVIDAFDPPKMNSPHVAWSPKLDRFAVWHEGTLSVFKHDGGVPVATIGSGNLSRLFWWHPSGEKILVNVQDVEHRLWDLHGNHTPLTLHGFLGFSPDGRFAVSSFGEVRDMSNAVVSTIDVTWLNRASWVDWTNRETLVFLGARGPGYSLEVSPSGQVKAQHENPIPLYQHTSTITADGEVLSLAGFGNTESLIYNWSTGDSTEILPAETSGGRGAAFTADGQFAWQIGNGRVHAETGEFLYGTGWGAGPLSWNRDGSLLAQAAQNKVRVWKGETVLATIDRANKALVRGLRWAPETDLLLVWDEAGNVTVWDPAKADQPRLETVGHGFLKDQHEASWPCWSPNGQFIAVPGKKQVRVLNLAGDGICQVDWDQATVGSIWWWPDSKRIVVGSRIFDLEGEQRGSIPGLEPVGIAELRLSNENTAIGWHHRTVLFWDNFDKDPARLRLPQPGADRPEWVGPRLRGMNRRHVSPDGSRLLMSVSMASSPGSPFLGHGDISLVDIPNREHLWTGIAFTDGQQIRIAPTGQILSKLEAPDKYLAYVLRYNNGRMLSVTPSEFAARIGMTEVEQLIQELLDFGAALTLDNGEVVKRMPKQGTTPIPPDSIVQIDLAGNRWVTDEDLAALGLLKSVRTLDLSDTKVSTPDYLREMTGLRSLNVSGTGVQNTLGPVLPTGLEELDLSRTEIGDFLLFDLAKFKNLRSLSVTESNVSEEAVTKLKQSRPAIRISR